MADVGMFSLLSQSKAARGGRAPFTLGFARRLLFTSGSEKALLGGCQALRCGQYQKALALLRKSVWLADGAYLAGFAALAGDQLVEACRHFSTALAKQRSLGQTFEKYEISARILLRISDEVSTPLAPTPRTVLLGWVQACKRLKRHEETIQLLDQARQSYPDDLVVKLVAAELLLEAAPDDRNACVRVVKLSEGVRGDSDAETALLLSRARALRHMVMLREAHSLLTAVIKRGDGLPLPLPLLLGLRYERALTLEEGGQFKAAAEEFRQIYRQAPDFKDVALRAKLAGPLSSGWHEDDATFFGIQPDLNRPGQTPH